jgi:hypothetical protein
LLNVKGVIDNANSKTVTALLVKLPQLEGMTLIITTSDEDFVYPDPTKRIK